jgi:hypothetical protein
MRNGKREITVKTLTRSICQLVLMCALLAGCGARDKHGATTQSQESAKSTIASQMQIAAQTAQTYRAMDNAALLRSLAEQSKAKREPFNSLAYRELKGRKDVDARALVSLVHETNDGNALLPLLLLRKVDEKSYLDLPAELRAGVLTDALQNSKMFNAWGLPHAYLEDASQAMLESGKSAYPALRRMLSDTRPAPSFGSQEYMEYKRYGYRLCDYALFFLERLQGNAGFRMPVAVADRDKLIKELSAQS